MKGKISALLLVGACLLTGCGKKEASVIHPVTEFLKMDTNFKPEGNYKIGILQPVAHGALDAAAAGFREKLAELGWKSGQNVTFEFKNAYGNDADLSMFADNLIADCDMVLGLGTGATQRLKSAQFNKGSKKPILFTAVTDPVESKLVHANNEPGGYITGTSDAQPITSQIELIKECVGANSTVGVIYTQNEDNSKIQAVQAVNAIKAAGMKAALKTVDSRNAISSAVLSLITDSHINSLYIPTDNNIASSMSYVMDVANQHKILVCCGEENMVASGGHITLSIDYNALGRKTADMAAEILNGNKSPNQLVVEFMKADQCEYVMSSKNLKAGNIELPASVLEKPWRDLDKEEK